jgi:hypothetical protein
MMRITPLTGIAAIAGIISLGQFGPAFGEDHGSMTAATSPDDARIRIGFKIAPVKLNLRGKNRAQVGLGSYIVNAQAGCSDCHTYPSFAAGGDPFFGQPEVINKAQYLTGGRQFGPFTSANLTPDKHGRPAGLTFPEFKTVMRTGVDPDGPRDPLPPLLQVMPWPVYAKMNDRDLHAIYEYLRAIPSRPDNPNPGS